MNKAERKWSFWIDRGGTFTDIVARDPEGNIKTHKLLSKNIKRYQDAPVQGIRELLNLKKDQPVLVNEIDEIKMGTTVATNALLERKGERTVLILTKGFKDTLRIGYQNRPDIFAINIDLPEMLYERVIEVDERITATGEVLKPFSDSESEVELSQQLKAAYNDGIRSCAIVLLHGYKYPEHEREIEKLAREIGFKHISVSHRVSPLIKLVSRGDTTVADAYLSPVLNKYIDKFNQELKKGYEIELDKNSDIIEEGKLFFMQSNGGLIDAENFLGKDSILSGPAGGIVGAVQVCIEGGYDKIITFDMGGTSTDVAHYHGEYEREYETEIAGVRLRTPMLSIHTVAAGGGSILDFDGYRYRVGPDSAGADPGPASYRQGGPLTVTDCNLMLGRIQSDYFPEVFGEEGNLPLDREIVEKKFRELSEEINKKTGDNRSPEEVAAGFLEIAVENMANAIKKISLQRGYDLGEYTLCCFGGAGGQHACQIAEVLGINRILIHPYAGVLSAYGMGLADVRIMKQGSVEKELTASLLANIEGEKHRLLKQAAVELEQDPGQVKEVSNINIRYSLHLRYKGSDFSLQVADNDDYHNVKKVFEANHQQVYGFIYEKRPIILESITLEMVKNMDLPEVKKENKVERLDIPAEELVPMFDNQRWVQVPLYQRDKLLAGDTIQGPALIAEETGTNVILSDWKAEINEYNHLILTYLGNPDENNNLYNKKELLTKKELRCKNNNNELQTPVNVSQPDPVQLEIFNNLFRSVAEEMGIILQKTAVSVNIKERLDFSCAIFNSQGNLVANAPHIPVHLGSMSESVRALICDKANTIKAGDVYLSNNPYNGGTHLPDLTVITPVSYQNELIFFLAARGHHADIGGINPGSMPPFSKNIVEEGILIDNLPIVRNGVFQEEKLRDVLSSGKYPARNLEQNLADIRAQIAANKKGIKEIRKMIEHYGLETVTNYVGFVQDNAENTVREALKDLDEGQYSCQLDSGEMIKVDICINHKSKEVIIDFSGSSKQTERNFNAPKAVVKAAVLYVFRCLVNDDIPLNEGCLRPLEIIIPEGSILNPDYPAAVVAGNVETSQIIVDTLFAALQKLAPSQGTMNNFTFGNSKYQYYETICGGTGAGPKFAGTSAVQSHMTNSRLTDPEVLESRFPVLVEEFSIRRGSGGKGLYDGGDGVIRKIKFREEMTAAILSGRREVAPPGIKGGRPGLSGRNYIVKTDGTIHKLTGTAVVDMAQGDIFVIETGSVKKSMKKPQTGNI